MLRRQGTLLKLLGIFSALKIHFISMTRTNNQPIYIYGLGFAQLKNHNSCSLKYYGVSAICYIKRKKKCQSLISDHMITFLPVGTRR